MVSCMIISSYPTLYMSLWLKAEGYSVTQTNNLPTIIYAINIVASWLGTTLAAIYPSWIIYTIASACCLFSTICMIVWDIPTTLKFVCPRSWTTYILTTIRFVAWYLFGLAGCTSPILYSTVNTIVKDDSEERALILVCIFRSVPWHTMCICLLIEVDRVPWWHSAIHSTSGSLLYFSPQLVLTAPRGGERDGRWLLSSSFFYGLVLCSRSLFIDGKLMTFGLKSTK